MTLPTSNHPGHLSQPTYLVTQVGYLFYYLALGAFVEGVSD